MFSDREIERMGYPEIEILNNGSTISLAHNELISVREVVPKQMERQIIDA
jgi:hypothetical protein